MENIMNQIGIFKENNDWKSIVSYDTDKDCVEKYGYDISMEIAYAYSFYAYTASKNMKKAGNIKESLTLIMDSYKRQKDIYVELMKKANYDEIGSKRIKAGLTYALYSEYFFIVNNKKALNTDRIINNEQFSDIMKETDRCFTEYIEEYPNDKKFLYRLGKFICKYAEYEDGRKSYGNLKQPINRKLLKEKSLKKACNAVARAINLYEESDIDFSKNGSDRKTYLKSLYTYASIYNTITKGPYSTLFNIIILKSDKTIKKDDYEINTGIKALQHLEKIFNFKDAEIKYNPIIIEQFDQYENLEDLKKKFGVEPFYVFYRYAQLRFNIADLSQFVPQHIDEHYHVSIEKMLKASEMINAAMILTEKYGIRNDYMKVLAIQINTFIICLLANEKYDKDNLPPINIDMICQNAINILEKFRNKKSLEVVKSANILSNALIFNSFPGSGMADLGRSIRKKYCHDKESIFSKIK